MIHICENCGKEHDSSYGTGRFCSDHCRRVWVGKVSYGTRVQKGTFVSNLNAEDRKRAEYGRWKCTICGQIFNTRRDMQLHRKDAHDVRCRDGQSWNRGLTKETSESVRRNAKHVADTLKKKFREGYDDPNSPFCRSYWTPERRMERSEQKKQLYKEHPEKHPNRRCAGKAKGMSYPEKVARDWLQQNNIDFIQQYHFVTDKFNRYVDFYCEKFNLFIEIDGEYWHRYRLYEDKNKDEDASAHGIRTLRVSAKSRIYDTLKEFFENNHLL